MSADIEDEFHCDGNMEGLHHQDLNIEEEEDNMNASTHGGSHINNNEAEEENINKNEAEKENINNNEAKEENTTTMWTSSSTTMRPRTSTTMRL